MFVPRLFCSVFCVFACVPPAVFFASFLSFFPLGAQPFRGFLSLLQILLSCAKVTDPIVQACACLLCTPSLCPSSPSFPSVLPPFLPRPGQLPLFPAVSLVFSHIFFLISCFGYFLSVFLYLSFSLIFSLFLFQSLLQHQ